MYLDYSTLGLRFPLFGIIRELLISIAIAPAQLILVCLRYYVRVCSLWSHCKSLRITLSEMASFFEMQHCASRGQVYYMLCLRLDCGPKLISSKVTLSSSWLTKWVYVSGYYASNTFGVMNYEVLRHFQFSGISFLILLLLSYLLNKNMFDIELELSVILLFSLVITYLIKY